MKKSAYTLVFAIFLGLITAFCGQAQETAGSNDVFRIIVAPYMQYPTPTSMIFRWETSELSTSVVEWGKKATVEERQEGEGMATMHEVKVDGLKPSSYYFYRVRSVNAAGEEVTSDVYTFQTAVEKDQPFSFVVLSDTQDNGVVLKKVSTLAYKQRPNFSVNIGDLVSEGPEKNLWVNHYFSNSEILNTRVPLLPTIGNHERDSHFYYDYFSLPEPEYYYSMVYGNLEMFILDSEKPVQKGSEQYEWLAGALKKSTATWKIVFIHCPAYSSDSDDYGDTAERRSVFGDFRMRRATELYDKYNVDIVWSGHIHSYERTFPLYDNKVVQEGGTVYLITGGGGGHLEEAGPFRSAFTAKVLGKTHHYCYVMVNGGTLRMDAYDIDGRLFDTLELKK